MTYFSGHAVFMARPINPTPPIEGDDAERLLEELEKTAPPDEISRRRKNAERYLKLVGHPKEPYQDDASVSHQKK